MRSKKEITFNSENKLRHNVNDSVNVQVSMKNVKKISINIFEINLTKYYLQTLSPVQDDVDLSFLIPTHQEIYENPVTNPFQINTTTLKLDKIPNKMGLYVVDL